jgi:hypothetical protein
VEDTRTSPAAGSAPGSRSPPALSEVEGQLGMTIGPGGNMTAEGGGITVETLKRLSSGGSAPEADSPAAHIPSSTLGHSERSG